MNDSAYRRLCVLNVVLCVVVCCVLCDCVVCVVIVCVVMCVVGCAVYVLCVLVDLCSTFSLKRLGPRSWGLESA